MKYLFLLFCLSLGSCHLDWLPTGNALCTEKCREAYKNRENDTTVVYGIPSKDTMKGPRWLDCRCYTYPRIKK